MNDWSIEFFGNTEDKVYTDQRFNENLLTSCLTFMDLKIVDTNIIANDSKCEDAVNFIRVTGAINNLNVNNAYSDAVDADFSELKFNKIDIHYFDLRKCF